LELGFDACGFTTAEPPASGPKLEEWLQAGRHGDMAWIARNAPKRLDPSRVLPGARTVVTLATSYHREAASKSGGPASAPRVEIARYARHRDYHDVLAGPLQELSRFIDNLGGAGTRSLWYVDTGPILERDLAQRSGIGFVGKHTGLIRRELGNWTLLSEILTTLPLSPDPPGHNHCGRCTRCIEVCPTAAITGPFQLDARRCISYLTIELKGSIPVELRPAIGTHVFGCDDCLAVCPWNRFAREGRLMKAAADPTLDLPDLAGWLALDDAGFRRRFEGTPIVRAKRRGLLRNVAVVLGNLGDPRALPALRQAAADSEPLVAEHAAWAIERILSRPPSPSTDS
jgi:epoxyqueuosine reductase